jgi:menaquinone-dependent protoporphyrinogen IX oxidase
MSSSKTLIAYVSKGGATQEAAKKIAETLHSKFQLDVDIVDLKKQKPPDLSLYENIIVGGGVRGGRVYGKALKFLKNDFSCKKIAFFVSSSWAGTPGSYENAKARFVDKNLAKYPKINLVSSEAFGGRIRYFGKTMLDNTDLAKVEGWTEELGKKLIR